MFSSQTQVFPTEMLRAILAMELVVGLWYEWGRDRRRSTVGKERRHSGLHLL